MEDGTQNNTGVNNYTLTLTQGDMDTNLHAVRMSPYRRYGATGPARAGLRRLFRVCLYFEWLAQQMALESNRPQGTKGGGTSDE